MKEITLISTKGDKLSFTGKNGWTNWYELRDKHNNKVLVEIATSHADPKYKKSLPYLWKKAGYIQKTYFDWLSVRVYVYELDRCIEKYNPQQTKEHKINFKWLLPATKSNEIKLLNEVYRLANK